MMMIRLKHMRRTRQVKVNIPTKRAASTYDPTQPDKLWILETIAKVGIPLKVEDYEESLRNPKKFLKAKAAAKKAATKGGCPRFHGQVCQDFEGLCG